MGSHARPRSGRPPLRGALAVAVVAVALALAAVIVAVASRSQPTSSSAVPTASGMTPLGCPVPVAAHPNTVGEPELECTERALFRQVCEIDVDSLVAQEPSGGPYLRLVQYQGTQWWSRAFVEYQPANDSALVQVGCSIPTGGHTKLGRVTLTRADWEVIAAAGSTLPAALQPERLQVPTFRATQNTPSPTLTRDPTADAAAEDCSRRALDVFTRLARHQITLTQARQQLPAKVPPSALTSGLAGVQSYQSDGLSTADAINESAGAVAQSCEY